MLSAAPLVFIGSDCTAGRQVFGITVNKNHLILCHSPKVTGSVSVWDLFLDFSPFLFTAGLKSLLQKSRYVTLNPLIQQFNIDLYMKRKSASSYFKAFVALFIFFFALEHLS